MLVKFNKETTMNAEGVRLIPGNNEVDDQKWALAAQHPIVKKMIEIGEIEVQGGTAGKKSQAVLSR